MKNCIHESVISHCYDCGQDVNIQEENILQTQLSLAIIAGLRQEKSALQSALTTAQEENKKLKSENDELKYYVEESHPNSVKVASEAILKLQEENKRYRDALESVAFGFAPDNGQEKLCIEQMQEVAQSALNGGK